MPRIARSQPTSRLNLEIAEQVREKLERLRDSTNADSLTEVIRRALAVYDILHSTAAEGGTIILKTGEGEQKLVIPEFSNTGK